MKKVNQEERNKEEILQEYFTKEEEMIEVIARLKKEIKDLKRNNLKKEMLLEELQKEIIESDF